MEEHLDLTKNPGLGVCDKCERIKDRGWFGVFCLCQDCARFMVEAIGPDAVGRAIERIDKLLKEKGHGKSGSRNAAA